MTNQQSPRANLDTGAQEYHNTNTENLLKNAPEVVEMGKKASQAWKSADRENNKGDQLAIFALFHAFHKVSFLGNIVDRQGNIEDTFTFDLADLATEPKNESGGRDNKTITARTNAIAEFVFGIEPKNVDQAFKNRLNRAMVVVFHFVRLNLPIEKLELATKGGKQMLKLPYAVLFSPPKPNDKGEVDEEALDKWNANKDRMIFLDGTKEDGVSKSVAELQRHAKPPVERKRDGANEKKPEDKAAGFKAAVGYTVATLHQINKDEGKETDVAFSSELRLQLWDLHQLLTTYFEEIDPLSKEEEGEIEKKLKTANGNGK